MKKLLTIIVALGVAMGVGAQGGYSLKENSFLSFSGGIAMYGHDGDSPSSGFGFSAALGQWIIRPLAFRIAYDGVMAPSYAKSLVPADGDVLFHLVSGEFMWDITSTLGRVHLFGDHLGIYPIVGLGLLRRGEDDDLERADNEFQSMLGLQVAWHEQRDSRFDLFLEVKNFFLPQGFDASRGSNNFFTANLGFAYFWGRSYYRGRRPYETRNLQEDWFVGFGGGALFCSFEFSNIFNDKASKLWYFTPEIMLGRNYSSAWTIRLELSGLMARENYRTRFVPTGEEGLLVAEDVPGMPYKFNMLHADLMLNLCGLNGLRQGRKWAVMPYIGAGPIWRYGSHPQFNVAGDAGFLFRRYVSQQGDFYMDLKYVMVTPRTAGGTGPNGYILGVGYPMFTIGYIHNFNHSTTSYRQPTGASSECAF